MKYLSVIVFFILSAICYSENGWTDIAVIEGIEIHVDTSGIERKDGYVHAEVKTVYTHEGTRRIYVDKIRMSYPKQDAKTDKKMKKWDDFGYNISTCIFDCTNKQYMITGVTDYDSKGKKIIQTKTPEKKLQWLDIGTDTMGDYMIYYICDFDTY